LKFNQSFEKCREGEIMQYHETLTARLVNKLVLDILPAATASLIGGLVFTHYGLGHVSEPAAQVAPASPEMMELLRDEHGLMVAFLNAELAREKAKLAAEDVVPGNDEVATAANTANPPMQTSPATAARPALAHTKTAVTAPVSAPLVIAQVQPLDGAVTPGPQSFIAKTIGLKDHVVLVTHQVVSVLGGIPGWIGLVHTGATERPHPAADMVTAS
jgi:hypothetical protein